MATKEDVHRWPALGELVGDKRRSGIMMLSLLLALCHPGWSLERVFVSFPGGKARPGLKGEGLPAGFGGLPSAGEAVLFWQQVREAVDETGDVHRFFQEFMRPPKAWKGLLEAEYQVGIPILGARVGFHEKNGKLWLVYGYHVLETGAVPIPAVKSRRQALEVAKGVAARHPELRFSWEAREADILPRVNLFLEELREGSLRLTWEVPGFKVSGKPVRLVMDAGTGELVRLVPEALEGNCGPATSQLTWAVAYPQNPALPSRSVPCTAAGERTSPWTHEAHFPGSNTVPRIEVYFSYRASQPAPCTLLCLPHRYGLVPLQSPGGVPTYTDWTSPELVAGKEAGDALHNTKGVFTAFYGLFRWRGWDGNLSPAKVVINDVDGGLGADNAQFQRFAYPCATNCGGQGQTGDCAPEPHVGVTYASLLTWSYAAALDVLAHEWGHGVIHSTADFLLNDVGSQLHEGFADFLGYACEQYLQPWGNGFEMADWMLGEDASAQRIATRRVDVDDGDQPNPPSCRAALGECDYAFHRDDDPSLSTAHGRGNQLPVAFRLLQVGGKNPVCGRLPQLSGCNVTVPGLGFVKAAKIFFYVLAYLAVPATQWGDLPDLGKAAAFALYARCSSTCDNKPVCWAELEQRAVEKAFHSIGYAGDGTVITCLP